ncbi:alpha/beta fold hydrolase [Hamadaea tsunoensis]|uniref:alpha/beta fold hydrolase n=1 Tax=Hamadaea tsunoensis TaxID=53368 RepID=UPI00041FF240|nr:alpha/beta hydrolase [Hamadaea tsunoensis]
MPEDESVLSRAAEAPTRTVAYGGHPDQVFDVFPGAAERTAVLLHGGFWRPAYDRVHLYPMANAMQAAGWTAITVEFRRIPGDPGATVEDVRAALSAVGGEVVLLGHSAGGHLALHAAATAPQHVRGVVALAPVADLARASALGLSGNAVAAFLGDHDPAGFDPRLLAPRRPVTIVHGSADETVPIEVAESYRDSHPDIRFVRLPGEGHYCVIDPLTGPFQVVLDEAAALG